MAHSPFVQSVIKWKIAVRPFAYTASVLPVCLGAAIAEYETANFNWPLFLLTLLGVVFFHTTANLLNDFFDYRRGLDQEVHPFSGALVRGILSGKEILLGAAFCLCCGICIGLYLVYAAGWVVLGLGLVGTFCALAYTTPGPCLKYMALGDIAIVIAFGVLPTFGSYWVQTTHFSWTPVFWGIALVLFTVGILHSNNWRDIDSDSAKECNTLAAILGDKISGIYYYCLLSLPYLLVTLLFISGSAADWLAAVPWTVFAVFLSLPLAVRNISIGVHRKSEEKNKLFLQLDGLTAQLHMAFGSLLVLAFITEGWL
ncbi:MAG: 1,4-dihydroxy-2-naphthoate octaprenyltransferase [Planctomycetota bacterium]|jgi:1,4-dihydroxy-2-naphthoate octaprenyltransferase